MSFVMESKQGFGSKNSFTMPPRQVYSFPILKSSEIMLCLNELGITISEEDIAHPEKNKDQVRRIYEYLTELCTGITREEISQPVFAGLKHLSFPDLHEDSVPYINSFRACQKMMEVCGIHDFTIKDLMSPTAKRFRRQLSGILNFAKFREERFALLNDLTGRRESILSAYNKSKNKSDELTRKLAHLHEQTKEEVDVMAELEADCKRVEATIGELNHKQAEMREDIACLKSDNTKLKDALAARNVYLEELYHGRRKLQSQIVSSPARFRKQITDVATCLQEEQQSVRSSERKHRELLAWSLYLDECLGVVSAAQDSLNDLHVAASKYKTAMQELDEYDHQVELKRGNLQNLELSIHQLQRQGSRSEEKVGHIRTQAQNRTRESRHAIDLLHSQIVKAERFRQETIEKAEKMEADVRQLQREMGMEKQFHDQEIGDMISAYRKAEKLVYSHLNGIHEKLYPESDMNLSANLDEHIV
mmetsp:Transcript_14324/g.21451  ORF Transcript_14324/g.21451 Transcript_14324/m.21451 type:complete len:476 (+) Transcript_14324:73-1500(+)